MTAATKPYPGAFHRVAVGGVAIPAVFGDHMGAVITNPASSIDQGVSLAEPLYYSYFDEVALSASGGTYALNPGETLYVPAGLANTLKVNATTSGHMFAVFVVQPAPQSPTKQAGDFPPSEVVTKTKTIPSYLYQEYNDDDDLSSFVEAYNSQTQAYIDGFNSLNLPVYTEPQISDLLLDWVARGLYGYDRPVISSGKETLIGPVNSFTPNQIPVNYSRIVLNSAPVAANDDIYKRSITWHFLKGDGKVFNVRWLKRRIMRWLLGENGVNFNPDSTYQVSVSFGVGNEVSITLVRFLSIHASGAFANGMAPNQFPPNLTNLNVIPISPLPNSALWKEAVQSGLLELPFQFDYVINA